MKSLFTLLATLILLHGAWASTSHVVYFDVGSDRLSETDRIAVERLAESFDGSFTLIGRTDDTGSLAHNERLAMRRAEAVRRALVEAGVPDDRIEIVARPAEGPLSGDKRRWRRVDIYIDAPDERLSSPRSSVVGPLRVGRYSVVDPVPSPEQRDPMRTIVHVRFPRSVRHVGEALDYLLVRSGWRLESSDLHRLLSFSLPETQRDLGPLPLVDAIEVLCGPAYVVALDPLHRLVTCVLKPDFTALYEQGEPE